VDAATDVGLRAGLAGLAAVTAFAGTAWAYYLRRQWSGKEALVVSAVYWGVSAADGLPLLAAWMTGAVPRWSETAAIAIYVLSLAVAAAWYRAGYRRAVAAAAVAFLARWALYVVFGWTYTFAVQ